MYSELDLLIRSIQQDLNTFDILSRSELENIYDLNLNRVILCKFLKKDFPVTSNDHFRVDNIAEELDLVYSICKHGYSHVQ